MGVAKRLGREGRGRKEGGDQRRLANGSEAYPITPIAGVVAIGLAHKIIHVGGRHNEGLVGLGPRR